jgi:eukaryotic-like serine/threonine-protein kinase
MTIELGCGARLGRFELLTRIGRGGTATVWAARADQEDPASPPIVAIKILRPEVENQQSFREMFLYEGRCVQAILHEHVVKVYEVGEAASGELYMAMEWIDGDSLDKIVVEANKRGPIPIELAVKLVSDVASGLSAVHNSTDALGRLQGLVHCDVSPHNVLVGEDGSVKVADFGVASAANQMRERPQELRGKFAYMSPEQTFGERLDRRSDLFSLGVVLFELTTGQRLFKGRDPRDTVERVRGLDIPRPGTLRTPYPAMLEQIVRKALNRDPEFRFQSAEEFQGALDAFLRSEKVFVPRAGVGGLIRRVLSAKLDERRERLRACLLALDT